MNDVVVLERPEAALRDNRPGNLRSQRIYILPTRHGIIFAFLLLCLLLGAVNYNNNLAFILTFLLASLFMICIIHTYRNVSGMMIRAIKPKPVYAGERVQFPLILDNHGGPSRVALVIEQYRGGFPRPVKVEQESRIQTSVLANRWRQISFPVIATSRGVIALPRLRVSSSHPLGLFRAWSIIELIQNCLVYPKPIGILPLPTGLSETHPALVEGDSGDQDFAGFRRYHAGDSIRNIAWKAVAREQPVLIKRFHGDGGFEYELQWDNPALSMYSTEERLSQLCQWVLEAERSVASYSLILPNQTIEADRGEHHKTRCLEALARYGYPIDGS